MVWSCDGRLKVSALFMLLELSCLRARVRGWLSLHRVEVLFEQWVPKKTTQENKHAHPTNLPTPRKITLSFVVCLLCFASFVREGISLQLWRVNVSDFVTYSQIRLDPTDKTTPNGQKNIRWAVLAAQRTKATRKKPGREPGILV